MSWKMEKQLSLTAVLVTSAFGEGITPSIRPVGIMEKNIYNFVYTIFFNLKSL